MSVLGTTAPQPLDGGSGAFWSSVREALRGSHQDYTQGNLNRAILLLAIPMVLEMVLESLFAVVDVFFVGRLGANAVATVGLTESMLALVMAIGMGVAMSTTAMVARRIGEKDPEDAAIAGVQAVVLGLAISAAIGIPAGIFAVRFTTFLRARCFIAVRPAANTSTNAPANFAKVPTSSRASSPTPIHPNKPKPK